jgi:hypothetical protein
MQGFQRHGPSGKKKTIVDNQMCCDSACFKERETSALERVQAGGQHAKNRTVDGSIICSGERKWK